jgi:hypothetical protein
MGLRERVSMAISSPVAEARKILDETPHADEHVRLSVLLDGWFRGIAGALDELAVEMDAQREERRRPDAPGPPAPAPAGAPAPESAPKPEARGGEESQEPLDEAQLADRARASRDETAAVRAEAETTKPQP